MLLIAPLLTLGACDNPPPVVAKPPTFAPSSLPAASLVHEPFSLEGVVFSIPMGAEVGWHRYGCRLCEPRSYVWAGGRSMLPPEDFAQPFFDTMTAAGYRVAGNPSQLFDRDTERARARFLVAAKITSISFSLQQLDWALTGPSSEGSATIDVSWQIYSVRDRRVVYDGKTSGDTKMHQKGIVGSPSSLVMDAFGSAAAKLAVDRRFQAAIATPADVIPAALGPDLDLPRFTPFTGPATTRLSNLLGSTVTIFTHSHGSGFFISDDGLILTNQHVVGDAETVNVRLLAGVEVVGRVLRRHALRDVALVKVDLTRTRPLPLRLDSLRVGEEVNALGAPVQARLAGSATRGIVSAVRRETRGGVELGMIQSDAAIQGGNSGGPLLDSSGNVVGIAVEGLGRMNTGLNFFIPIDEALHYLNVRLGSARELRF